MKFPGRTDIDCHGSLISNMTESSPKPNVEYVIFDMDGLLIDTERIHSIVTNEILSKYGKEMTWDIKAGGMGKPAKDSAIHLLSFFPDIPLDLDAYLEQSIRMKEALWPTATLLPGVHKLVHHLKKHNVPIAVATSTSRRKYDIKTAHLQSLFECFERKVICGDHKYDMKGKPAPDIFIITARDMLHRDVGHPEVSETEIHIRERGKGLVFEDSLAGVQSGKRAGMSVVWVPDSNILKLADMVTEKADQILDSLENFIPEQWGLPPYDKF